MENIGYIVGGRVVRGEKYRMCGDIYNFGKMNVVWYNKYCVFSCIFGFSECYCI